MNIVLLIIALYLPEEPVAGTQDFYNFFSSDYSIRWDYFKDGIPFILTPSKDFEFAINQAHRSLLLFKNNSITYPDSQTIVSIYSERDRYEGSLNGFSFQRSLFKKFLNFKTGYDIYTSKVFSEIGTLVQHHYFFQGYRKNTFHILFYHSDFDYPFYYLLTNIPQREKFEIYQINYYFKNIKFLTDYQYLANFLNHSSLFQFKSEIALDFSFKLLNFNLILKNKTLKSKKEEWKYRPGGLLGMDFKKFFYINFDYEKDKNLHNQFLLETAFNLDMKKIILVPFYSSMLLFPNPVIESSIFPLYSTSNPERERRNIAGFYIFDKNLKYVNLVYEYANVKNMKILDLPSHERDTLFGYDTLSTRFHSLQGNFYEEFNEIFSFNKIYFKSSLVYNNIKNFYPNFTGKFSFGIQKIVKGKVKLIFEYSTFLTEKTNMNSLEFKTDFFDALFITFRANNIFGQKFYLLEGFNFYTTHLTLAISANLWD